MIPFNKPFLTGKETTYIADAVNSGKISGNGIFTKRCHTFFEKKYGFQKCLLTSSCTDALEMAAILINTKPGDEIIMPSYTFVSTANPFILRGGVVVFADVSALNPNLDVDKIESLINERTKAIVCVHYAGVACDMDALLSLAIKFNLFLIEDAAQAIDSFYIDKLGVHRPLGSIGHLSTFSFHETKNIISGEGGMLVINDAQFAERAEVIWEKGTNRSAFFRKEVNKYGWIDIGSSFLPSEITAAFLFAQLETLELIQTTRTQHWLYYFNQLSSWAAVSGFKLPVIPKYATNNAHLFYLVAPDKAHRDKLLEELQRAEITAVFHYLSLHSSDYYIEKHDGRELPFTDHYSSCLVRLPLFFELSKVEIDYIIATICKINF